MKDKVINAAAWAITGILVGGVLAIAIALVVKFIEWIISW